MRVACILGSAMYPDAYIVNIIPAAYNVFRCPHKKGKACKLFF
jgi:hypothetical protein